MSHKEASSAVVVRGSEEEVSKDVTDLMHVM